MALRESMRFVHRTSLAYFIDVLAQSESVRLSSMFSRHVVQLRPSAVSFGKFGHREIFESCTGGLITSSIGEDDGEEMTLMDETSGDGRGGDELRKTRRHWRKRWRNLGILASRRSSKGRESSSDGTDAVLDDELRPEDGEDDGLEECDDADEYGELY
ncbi:hypothetical protein BU15DRAFT_67693 [Melanogaster broomeanus]|nr:hypothetical protein BU15DRAFT_67693 [Melanogaster broomeanus]